jgi:hypothetical protein
MDDHVMHAAIIQGGVTLTILCYKDYRASVVRPKSGAVYFAAFGLFALLNWAVYLTLCFYFINTNTSGSAQTGPENGVSALKYLIPFGIAFAYFGIGAGSIKLGAFEFRFYSKLLDLFRLMFPSEHWEINPEPEDSGGKDRYDLLRERINNLHLQLQAICAWGPEDETWREVEEDSKRLTDQIGDMAEIGKDLKACPLERNALAQTVRKVEEKLEKLWDSVNVMLTRYAIQLIYNNIKDTNRQEDELGKLGVLNQAKAIQSIPGNPASRVVGSGIFAGMLVGLASALSSNGEGMVDPMASMWCGVVAFTGFTLFFTRFHLLKDVGSALLRGSLGGLIGHFLWTLLWTQWRHPATQMDLGDPTADRVLRSGDWRTVRRHDRLGAFRLPVAASLLSMHDVLLHRLARRGVVRGPLSVGSVSHRLTAHASGGYCVRCDGSGGPARLGLRYQRV